MCDGVLEVCVYAPPASIGVSDFGSPTVLMSVTAYGIAVREARLLLTGGGLLVASTARAAVSCPLAVQKKEQIM